MSLGLPWALLGLLGIPVLILLERLRRRPREQVWPSLLLFRNLGTEPAADRRRIEPLLLYECAAVALLALAAAAPRLEGAAAGRTVVVFVDAGAHMEARRADGQTARAATRAEIDRLREALGPADDVRVVPVRGDLATLVAEGDGAVLRFLATSRPVESTASTRVFGRAPSGDNLAIDAVEVSGDVLWFAAATDGEPREIRVRAGDEVLAVRTGEGRSVPFVPLLEILDEDNYDADDRVEMRRFELRVRDETGSRYVRAAIGAGLPAVEASDPQLVLTGQGGEPVEGVVHGAACVATGPLFEGLFLDDCHWSGVRAREGAGELIHEGRALAAWLDAQSLWLGLPLDREWDEHGTLPLLIERAKRQRAEALLAPGEALAGEALVEPVPGLVDTKGLDRPWDGSLPEPGAPSPGDGTGLRMPLALLAAAVLALYLHRLLSGARPDPTG